MQRLDPLLKKHSVDPSELQNYRPIALLLSLLQFTNHLEKIKLLDLSHQVSEPTTAQSKP